MRSGNNYIIWCLLGLTDGIDPVLLQRISWFGKLVYEDLPQTTLPRLPFKQPIYEGECIWVVPGPSHSAKNCTGAVASPARTIMMFGRYMVDNTTCLDFGLAPPAYGRADATSDKQTAQVNNPLVSFLHISMSVYIYMKQSNETRSCEGKQLQAMRRGHAR